MPCHRDKDGRAAQRDLPITALTVDIEADGDERADFGQDDVPPGFTEFRVRIAAQSPVKEKILRAAIEHSLAMSPILDLFVRAQEVKLSLSLAQIGTVAE